MLEHGYYNMDCMQGMKEFPDKYFDLAIVDPPYGIKEDGKKNACRSKLATSKAYKSFAGGTYNHRTKHISKNYSELVKIKSYSAQIILYRAYPTTARAG